MLINDILIAGVFIIAGLSLKSIPLLIIGFAVVGWILYVDGRK